MGLISRPFTYVSGTLARADEANANENALYNLVNGGLETANIAVGGLDGSVVLANASVTANKLASDFTISSGNLSASLLSGLAGDGLVVSGTELVVLTSVLAGTGIISSVLNNFQISGGDNSIVISDDSIFARPALDQMQNATVIASGSILVNSDANSYVVLEEDNTDEYYWGSIDSPASSAITCHSMGITESGGSNLKLMCLIPFGESDNVGFKVYKVDET